MEPFIENRYIVSEKILEELYQSKLKAFSVIRVVVLIMYGFIAITFLIKRDYVGGILMLIVWAGLLVFVVTSKRSFAKKSLKQYQASNHAKEVESMSVLTEDFVICKSMNTNGELKYTYDEVIQCIESDTCFFIQVGEKNNSRFIVFHKRGFTIGNAEELKKRLEEECVNAKIKWK